MIPLFSTEQTRKADNYAMNKLHISGEVLMENAAINILKAIFEKYPYIDSSYSFGIICGKGNNGGDGFALTRQLLISGFNVHTILLEDEKDLKGDALINYKILKNFAIDYDSFQLIKYNSLRDLNHFNKCDIIVDAILGTGSSGVLNDKFVKIINKINELNSLKIAIDSPTGLNLNNASGDVIFNANLTVTLAELKTGLFYEKGKHNSGKVLKGSIGIGNKYFETLEVSEFLIEPEDVVNYLPKKDISIHKYSAGKVLTIAGSSNLPGAAIFSMNASMISGAGAGILLFPESIKELAQSQMNSAIVNSYNDNGDGFLKLDNISQINEKIKWADAVVIGPGLGRNEKTQSLIINLINDNPKSTFIIDADAIFSINNKKYRKIDLQGNVLTPHHQEFADLLGIDLPELKSNLLNYGKKFAKETKTILVLKGAPTIIFSYDGEVFINTVGNSGLAKYGSGDVLTGIIASFIAQQERIEESTIASVYLHSLTADLIMKSESEFGITPLKLIEKIPSTVKFLRKSVV